MKYSHTKSSDGHLQYFKDSKPSSWDKNLGGKIHSNVPVKTSLSYIRWNLHSVIRIRSLCCTIYCYNQSQNIVAQSLFSLKNMHAAPRLPPPSTISPIQYWESVKIVWNCADGCLLHLAGLKLKNSTLKVGEGCLCHNFCRWLSERQNYFDWDLP